MQTREIRTRYRKRGTPLTSAAVSELATSRRFAFAANSRRKPAECLYLVSVEQQGPGLRLSAFI